MPCDGNAAGHCCWTRGIECKYLETDTIAGRHWVCGLRRQHNNWNDMLNSKEYREDVAPNFAQTPGLNCRDYPEKPHGKCGECGFGVD